LAVDAQPIAAVAVADGVARADVGGQVQALDELDDHQTGQARLADTDDRDAFAREFLLTQALYEFLDPGNGFSPAERTDYRCAAKVYQSVQPAMNPDALLWPRLGGKTHELIAKHIGEVAVGRAGRERSFSTNRK
jgi:hypothetical protein